LRHELEPGDLLKSIAKFLGDNFDRFFVSMTEEFTF